VVFTPTRLHSGARGTIGLRLDGCNVHGCSHGVAIAQVAAEHPVMISVEEGAIGGFGEHVSRFLLSEGLLGGGKRLKFSPMGLPDRCASPRVCNCALFDHRGHGCLLHACIACTCNLADD